LLYSFLWVIPRRLNFMCRRFGQLCSIGRVNVPTGWHIKFRRRGITQKKQYNIRNTAKVWYVCCFVSTRSALYKDDGFQQRRFCLAWRSNVDSSTNVLAKLCCGFR